MAGDFVLLNLIIQLIANIYWRVDCWPERSLEIFILVNNLALLIAQLRFSTIIHLRLIGAGDLLQRMVLNDNKQSMGEDYNEKQ
jgi:putative colanic acid biosynthesis UDP-glucose lipid carrier transferase